MSNYVTTPASTFTDEDVSIINATKNVDTMAGMLVHSSMESLLFSQWEWETVWIKRQQWEMDNIY